ncbi:endosomal/lysosomal potassium channel TMEM175 isoform X5 [Cervus canadensis]|nr:endosomal/lysosomal potassium channel TMEM175 isoform X4 [Cervus canadensis]XP_043304468.1 endosomal/lysosomal potassium channel TMEM175 isoform X5 [Cervus canadensis]
MSRPQTPEPTLDGQGDASAGSPDEDVADGIQHSHRMLSFSDALLSIIATVMILPVTHTEISPEQEFDKSVQRLLATRIAVYLMTFLIVTVAWAAHTRLFQVVGKIDDTLALLNLACMMTITFLPFTVSHGGSWPPFHPGPSRPPLTPEHALLKALRPMGRCPGPRGCRGFQEPAGSVRGRGWGWRWGGAPSLLANLGSSLQVTHPLLTQQLLDSEGGRALERSASQRVGVWGAFRSLITLSFKGFKLQPKGSCGRDTPSLDSSAAAQARPSGLAGALMLWVFLAAVFLDGDLPRGASGHLPVLHVCDCHRGRAGADRALCLPLPAPPEPPDRALCPPWPLPAAHPGHHHAGPRALPGRRRLLPLLLPRGPREPPAHSMEVFTFDLHEPLSKERVEAFSDGVYAIVATLLILDI